MKDRKKLFLMFVFGILVMWGCEKSLSEYSGLDYIYFAKDMTQDSLVYCFGLEGVYEKDTIGLEVNISGMPSQCNRGYVVKISDNSELNSGSDIVLLESTFHAEQIIDTLWIEIKNSDKLKSGQYLLQLDLVENENFSLCFPKQNSAKIYLTDVIVKPDWWNEEQVNEGLGVYSETKYRLFIYVCKVKDFGQMEFPERRDAILRFRKYLNDEAKKGNVIMDEDGLPMKVTIYG